MNQDRPKSVKNIGIVLIVLSIMLIFCNSLGAVMFHFVMEDAFELKPGQAPTILNYYLEMCLTLVIAGILFLISGICIRKYKKWANRFTTVVSISLILWVWIWMMILILPLDFHQNYSIVLVIVYIIIGVVVSVPLCFLIRFLNRKHIIATFT